MESFNINYWIYQFFIKNDEAFSALKDLFRPLILHIISLENISLQGCMINQSDFYSLADTVLLKCLYRYQYLPRKSFAAFYKRALLNTLMDAYRSMDKQKAPYSYSVSLDSLIHDSSSQYLGEHIGNYMDSTHQLVMHSIQAEHMQVALYDQLNLIQSKVFELKLLGYKRQEICRLLKISPQSFDYTMKKIKRCLCRIDSQADK